MHCLDVTAGNRTSRDMWTGMRKLKSFQDQKLNGEDLERVDRFQYLGVYFDKNDVLEWQRLGSRQTSTQDVVPHSD